MNRLLRFALLGMLIIAGMSAARVGTAAEANQCRLNVTPLSFGKVNPFSPVAGRANGSITYNCTVSAPIAIGFEAPGGSGTRRMKQGAVGLDYDLYLDAACTIVWGNGAGGSQLFRDPAPPPNSNVTVPVYGCLHAGQRSALMGNYGDSFIVTIQF